MNIKFFNGLDYKKELNSQQLDIVKEKEGPTLILAGAGSGKTRILVYRVCHLIEKGVAPSSILLVTFTNKAAKEMIQRVEALLGAYPKGLWAGTFHHVANIMLRTHGSALDIEPNYTILDEEDSVSILKEIVKEKVPADSDFPPAAKIKKILSLSANTMTGISDIVNTRMPKHSSLISRIENICSEYGRRKRVANLMDYDDLLVFWYKLLKNENTGAAISSQFSYILVDEYHDTNRLQSRILYLLAKPYKNITVVGDDAQSIYSFRGATISNIMEFSKVYPGAKTFYLNLNYRSTPEILHFANESISNNRVQYLKNLKSIRKNGIKPVLVRCYQPRDEAEFVSRRVLQLVTESGVSPLDIGILFRSRYQAAELEMEFGKLKIPYIVRGGMRFFEQAHVKDMVAYFRAVENFSDRVAWRRLFNLTGGIGAKTAEKLLEHLNASGSLDELYEHYHDFTGLNARSKKNLGTLLQSLVKIKECKDIPEGIDLVMDRMYAGYIERKYKDDSERLQDIKMLKEISSAYSSLADFIAESSLQEYSRGEKSDAANPVTLSTIHQAKGLEWKIVFIIGVCANHFPHPASASDIMALEEERRVFYVGITRAREDIYITYYLRDSYRTFTNRKSLFLEEIPPYLFEEWIV